ncbi:MAG TPA: DNRLRE domain-containing protein, partial [Chitinophagales bacterium]|nr:DNRLRE domain-containing protein [Chitinophagales bacterium]
MKHTLLTAAIAVAFTANAQTILTLQPGPEEGKDTKIWSVENNVNFGDYTEVRIMAWTWDGESGIERSLMEFDLSQIPQNAEICYAYLSLFANSTTSSQYNSSLSGPNTSLIRRVISPWEEDLVTWDSAPSTTTVNQVTIPESEEEHEDVLDIDVTELVKDIVADPANSFGFEFRLEVEEQYRRRVFAMSDFEDPSHYPKLEVCYTAEVGIEDNLASKNINVYPNPASTEAIVEVHDLPAQQIQIMITNIVGEQIFVDETYNATTNNIYT